MNAIRLVGIVALFCFYVLVLVLQTKHSNPFMQVVVRQDDLGMDENNVWSKEDPYLVDSEGAKRGIVTNSPTSYLRDIEEIRNQNKTKETGNNKNNNPGKKNQKNVDDNKEQIDTGNATVVNGPEVDPKDVRFWNESRIPNFYHDKFETYDCKRKYSVAGSHPKFMVLGVHKGGSTALYNYLAKHGRIRPAVCKEIHFFDVDEEFYLGKSYYLRNFPDVSMWRNRVITGEGSPNYIRTPQVPSRVKNMFPDTKFILTLREPGTRFQSHWVGKKDLHIQPFASMSCEEAWNSSVAAYEKCVQGDSKLNCEKKLHENAVVRGIYLPQIEHWLKYFPPEQFLIIQAETMFENITHVMQMAAKFLGIRPYNEEELASLHSAKTGSAHHDEPLARECDHLRERMNQFYSEPNRRLKRFIEAKFPEVAGEWLKGWSGM